MKKLSHIRARVGRKGGASTSPDKQAGSRANGSLGGRPRIYPKCPRYKAHRFTNDRCPCGFTRSM